MNIVKIKTEELFAGYWQELYSAIDAIDKKYPGVYLIAWSIEFLQGKKIKLEDIYYVGMTNSKGGVKSRLKQFRNGITKGRGHNGGNR